MSTTKKSTERTLFDTLSRLTCTQAAKLLGPEGKQLIHAGGAHDIDLETDVELNHRAFRVRVGSAAVTVTVDPASRDRLRWDCNSCDIPCEHAGAAFSLVLEEKLSLGLSATPQERQPIETLGEEELLARALADRAERAHTETMRLTSTNPQQIWTDYTVTNAASGRSYRVALRCRR